MKLNLIKKGIILATSFFLIGLTGCESIENGFGIEKKTVYIDVSGSEPDSETESNSESDTESTANLSEFPHISNNATIILEVDRYEAPIINRNKVTIIGSGNMLTTIKGDLLITGNSITVSKVGVNGNVILDGNNIVLDNVRVSGSITSTGNNNSW